MYAHNLNRLFSLRPRPSTPVLGGQQVAAALHQQPALLEVPPAWLVSTQRILLNAARRRCSADGCADLTGALLVTRLLAVMEVMV
jgi:hypothetical protein